VGNTLILNPGSLGQPRDGKGFCYCILDLEDFSYCFKKVKVDVDELLSQVKEKDGDKSVCTYLMNKYRS
jgi:diadenosine tetraphosphatase ApaH/serine/threonine PP2A family protein phosphatase